MSLFATLRRLKKLSPEQRKILRCHFIAGKRSYRVWLRVFRGLDEFDLLRDKAIAPLGWSIAGVLLLSIAALIIKGNLESGSQWEKPILVVLGLFVIMFVWLVSTLRKLKALDSPNTVRGFAYPFLKVLAVETSSANKADLAMNLRRRLDPKNIVFGPAPMEKARKAWISPKETRFEYPWLRISTLLADQTKMKLQVTDRVRQIHFRKRGSSGKIKFKTKYKVQVRIDASFLPPSSDTWVSVQRSVKSSDIDFVPSLDLLLDVVSSYYQAHPPAFGGSQPA